MCVIKVCKCPKWAKIDKICTKKRKLLTNWKPIINNFENVEYSGLEPLTSTLPVSRSSQMS